VRQALSEQERATQALEALRQDISVRVHREFRGVTEGILKVRALEQAVRSTEQVAMSTRRSYEAGVRTLNDTLNAEQQNAAARRDLSQARLMYLLSHIRLLTLVGAANTEAIQGFNAWLK
jgi:outer membrane protein TolC